MTCLDLWLRGSQHATHKIQGTGTCWSAHAHTLHLPLKQLEKMAAQDRLPPKWWLQLTFSYFFLRTPHLTGCQVNEQIWQRQLLHLSTIRLTGVPSEVDFYEVHFWESCLVLECSFVGEEMSAFVCLVSFYCYRRDNITTIISKIQSHKRANSRLQYINKW